MKTSNVFVKWESLNKWAARNLDCAELHNPAEPVRVCLTGRKVESVFKSGDTLLEIAWPYGNVENALSMAAFVPEYYVTDIDELAQRIVRDDVLVCDSGLVDSMLQNGTFSIEDIENMYGRKEESDLADEYPDEWHIWNTANNKPESFTEYLIANNKAIHFGEPSDDEQLHTEFPDELETWLKIDDLDTSDYASFADYLIEEHDIDESDIEDSNAEIYEWWQVDSWLEGKFRERGEAILSNEYGTWWGRRSTGQALYMDSSFQEIARYIAGAHNN